MNLRRRGMAGIALSAGLGLLCLTTPSHGGIRGHHLVYILDLSPPDIDTKERVACLGAVERIVHDAFKERASMTQIHLSLMGNTKARDALGDRASLPVGSLTDKDLSLAAGGFHYAFAIDCRPSQKVFEALFAQNASLEHDTISLSFAAMRELPIDEVSLRWVLRDTTLMNPYDQ